MFFLTVLMSSPKVVIDARYPLSAAFRNTFYVVERIDTSSGGRTSRVRTIDSGSIRIHRLPDEGRFLVSSAAGSYLERTQQSGKPDMIKHLSFHATSRFDARGFAAGGAADPAALIPIFPRHAVAVGDTWSVRSRVRSQYGVGEATYSYRVTSIEKNAANHTIARFSMTMRARLASGTVLLSGSGELAWDCTEHERASSTTLLVYRVHRRGQIIVDTQSERDVFETVR